MASSFDLFSMVIHANISGVFLPGDVISGYVSKLSSQIITKNVNITCRGKAFASLDGLDTSSSSSSRLRFKGIQYLLPATSKEEHFLLSTICLDEYLLQCAEEDAAAAREAGTEISTRPMVFKFHLRLPKVLPPSCHLHHGSTSYEVLFEWETWKGSGDAGGGALDPRNAVWEHHTKTIPITVAPLVNLNYIPFTAEPAQVTKHENFNFFCFNFGSMDVSMKVDKIGYVPGEELHFKVNVNNETKFDVQRITVTLKQERTFYVGELKKKFSKVLAFCEGPTVPQGETAAWEDFLVVPDCQWKFFWPCSLIQVLFFLQVKLTTYKNSCNSPETILESSLNVLLGDVPVDSELYSQTFGDTTGIFELTNAFYEPERLWLRIDCLSDAIMAATMLPRRVVVSSTTSSSTGGNTQNPNQAGEESSPALASDRLSSQSAQEGDEGRRRDETPSYSSLVIVETSAGRRRTSSTTPESPPPSYHDALRMMSNPSSPSKVVVGRPGGLREGASRTRGETNETL